VICGAALPVSPLTYSNTLNTQTTLDTVQAMLKHVASAELLLSVFSDSLACLRTLQLPGSMAVPEGRQLEVRLRLYMEKGLVPALREALGSPGSSTGEGGEAAKRLVLELRDALLSNQQGLYITARCALQALVRAAAQTQAAASPASSSSASKPSLQQTCIEVLLELQEAFFSKKNRNVLGTHGDFVNEVFSRQADFAAHHLLSALVSAVGTAKTAYLRGEASRVLAGFVNRGKALQPHSRAELLRQLPAALGHIATALSLLSEAPLQQQQQQQQQQRQQKGALAKTERPLLQAAKDLLTAACHGISPGGTGAELSPATKEALRVAIAARKSSSASPVVAALATQALQILEGVKTAPSSAGKRERSDSHGSGTGTKSKKGGKKGNP